MEEFDDPLEQAREYFRVLQALEKPEDASLITALLKAKLGEAGKGYAALGDGTRTDAEMQAEVEAALRENRIEYARQSIGEPARFHGAMQALRDAMGENPPKEALAAFDQLTELAQYILQKQSSSGKKPGRAR